MPSTRLTQGQRLDYMMRLIRIARETGLAVLELRQGDIYDTVQVGHHQFSTVDTEANRKLRVAIANAMGGFPVTILEESEITRTDTAQHTLIYPLLIGDAVEGSTNAKRGLAAHIKQPIRAGTSVMVLESEQLASVVASAFFDFATQQTFSSVRTETGSFLSFKDEQILSPDDVTQTYGDTQIFAAVPGYSHSNVRARAQVEEALLNADIYSTGGCRSSAQDLLDLIGNQVDAYVDLRTLFPGTSNRRDEVLHPWDVGGLLPVLDGLGFLVADPFNRSWQDYCFQDSLALTIARPSIGQRIQETIRDLPFVKQQAEKHQTATLPFSSTS